MLYNYDNVEKLNNKGDKDDSDFEVNIIFILTVIKLIYKMPKVYVCLFVCPCPCVRKLLRKSQIRKECRIKYRDF